MRVREYGHSRECRVVREEGESMGNEESARDSSQLISHAWTAVVVG